MKTLFIMRHAKSSWDQPGQADIDRPLNKRGMRDAPRMGEWMYRQKLIPDVIASSPANRAHTTARLVAEACAYKDEITLVNDFYAHGPQAYLGWLRDLPEEYKAVLVVGHNPDLEELLTILTGLEEPLPTAALAQVKLSLKRWAALSESSAGKVIKVWRPKELPKE
jgi:phosphohistidine phosphatase